MDKSKWNSENISWIFQVILAKFSTISTFTELNKNNDILQNFTVLMMVKFVVFHELSHSLLMIL